MYSESLLTYIHKKHNICSAKLDMINTGGLQSYLGKLKIAQRASVVKLIHNWIPTNALLYKQGCSDTLLCPRCHNAPEDTDHILTCGEKVASNTRQQILYEMLHKMMKLNTSIYILSTFENKFSNLLRVKPRHAYPLPESFHTYPSPLISRATRSQNLIGWNNFLKGYISKHWKSAQDASTSSRIPGTKRDRWDIDVTALAIDLLRKLWEDRNVYVHGKTIQEANEKLRARVHATVVQLYTKPPKLAPRYQKISTVSLEQRLQKPTKELQDWLARIAHQRCITELLNASIAPGQLTLQQACARQTVKQQQRHKYPP
jgi:hypothetical protein